MAKKRGPREPDYWTDILDHDGKKIGSWTIRDGLLLVYDMEGNSRTARPSPGGSAGLARIVLSEFARAKRPSE